MKTSLVLTDGDGSMSEQPKHSLHNAASILAPGLRKSGSESRSAATAAPFEERCEDQLERLLLNIHANVTRKHNAGPFSDRPPLRPLNISRCEAPDHSFHLTNELWARYELESPAGAIKAMGSTDCAAGRVRCGNWPTCSTR